MQASGKTKNSSADGASNWTIEQTGSERILCYWYEAGGNRLKREVAVICDWNSKADQEYDELILLMKLNDPDLTEELINLYREASEHIQTIKLARQVITGK